MEDRTIRKLILQVVSEVGQIGHLERTQPFNRGRNQAGRGDRQAEGTPADCASAVPKACGSPNAHR